MNDKFARRGRLRCQSSWEAKHERNASKAAIFCELAYIEHVANSANGKVSRFLANDSNSSLSAVLLDKAKSLQ